MSDGRRLTGYRHSVYTRAVRIALAVLRLGYRFDDVNPFFEEMPLHPFGRVPVLEDGGLRIYETWAILTYLARAHDRREETPAQAARAAQVAGIVNAYGYWPMVRQVYGHAVFRPAMGVEADPEEVAAGHAAAGPVLDALEEIAAEGLALHGRGFGPADWLLFPMVDAYGRDAKGAEALAQRPALGRWQAVMAGVAGVADTFAPLEAGL